MMKSGLIAICVLLLTACATPAELRAQSKPIVMKSRLQPEASAKCIARILINDGSLVTMLEGSDGASWEITVRIPGGLGAEALIEVKPDYYGSEVVYYFAPFNEEKRISEQLTAAC